MKKTLQHIRCACLVALTHHAALPALRYLRKAKPFPYSSEALLQMEKGTVGNDLALFLGEKKLRLLSHYARHDMKHVVLGFDTTEEGELCLQSFMLGNGRFSFPVIATVVFGLLLAPDHWKKMLASYRHGKQCIAIHRWNWYTLVTQRTETVRNQIYQKNQVT